MHQIFVINPGSTSTKLALFQGEDNHFAQTVNHDTTALASFTSILDQFQFRLNAINDFIQHNQIDLETIDAFVGRGGLLKPIPSGTYIVDQHMLTDLKHSIGSEHASNLGALLAYELGKSHEKPAFIVDPVVVDELDDIARLSGHPAFQRKSIFHALNQKSAARMAAGELSKPYEALNLIVAHLGGGISIGAHKHGKVVDVNNALDGEGPYSPERSGTLPAGDLVKLCFSGSKTPKEVTRMIRGQGGMVAYLGTNDMRDILKRIKSNQDKRAEQIYKGMAYQVAKTIGEMAVVLKGKVDAIILTGGIVYDNIIVKWITEFVEFIAPLFVYPGEGEMQALANGALRVLIGTENPKTYRENILHL